jgi:hypothetical protein
MTAPPVVVIGDVMTDVRVRHAGPVAPATDTPARIALRPAGSAANTATALGAAGVEPRLAVARGVPAGGSPPERLGRAAAPAARAFTREGARP